MSIDKTHIEKFAAFMSKKHGGKFTITKGSIESENGSVKGFDLDYDGVKYDGGSYYIDKDGSIINAADGNKKEANISQFKSGNQFENKSVKLNEYVDIDLNRVKFKYDKNTKTFFISEKDVRFATEYTLISPSGNKVKFSFTHSTGPEFDPKTSWIYKSSDGQITLNVANDLATTSANAKAYLNGKLRRESTNNINKLIERIVDRKLNESKSAIEGKDWDRMSDLLLKKDEGSNVAKSIKDKSKAIARFVTGLKLANKPLNFNAATNTYTGKFDDFGNKAIDLGATHDEIQTIYDITEIPDRYAEKLSSLGNKKLSSRSVSFLSKAIIAMGLDIDYLPHNGDAITSDGQEAMRRNGRKWTIGYKTEINLGDRKVKLGFDAITDEGDGPTMYSVDLWNRNNTDRFFDKLNFNSRVIGQRAFLEALIKILKEK